MKIPQENKKTQKRKKMKTLRGERKQDWQNAGKR
jgi:hypothetical protein